ncbi:hypothetical protein [Kitasatospora sp. A2-31]|uniref:hypothetical protein n=1 Tax=Kitasatospora sp. A2-31 TaxID=2916414 RepID=UPI001EEC48C4|nr:hypothetical protein [Kitasatospora sp. A2-31]MCG6496712.1 hypothetical protein [Kitasatospora sp. A2-31]
MRELIADLFAALRLFLAPGVGRRGKPSPLTPLRRRALALITPDTEPEPAAPVAVEQDDTEQPGEELVWGPLVRPYIDPAAWRAELDEMQRQYERREALRAVAEGKPDPGYTYPGAQRLAVAGV